jgi:dephospho-CoA kinase
MLKVGITGGIGSGKSVVCKIFNQLNVPIYDADFEAKQIIIKSKSVISKIKKAFGEDSYFEDGRLNIQKIASIIFSDKKALEKMNSIVHPAVFQDFEKWSKLQKNCKYVIMESALLIETGYYKQLDKTICVLSPLELRTERIMQRNNISKTEVNDRISSQLSDEEKLKFVDFTIQNDNEDMLMPQVLKLHEKFNV